MSEWMSRESLNDFLSGAVAGAVALTVGQPLDIIRVKVQQEAALGLPRRSALTVGIDIIQREGARALFKGLSLPVAFASIQAALLFQSYGVAMRYMGEHNGMEVDVSAPSTSHLESSSTSAVFTSSSTTSSRYLPSSTSAVSTSSCTASSSHTPSSTSTTATASVTTSSSPPLDQRRDQLYPSPASTNTPWTSLTDPSRTMSSLSGASTSAAASAAASGTGSSLPGPTVSAPAAAAEASGPATSSAAASSGPHHPNLWNSLIAGSFAGFIQVFLWQPIELVKLRTQLQKASVKCASHISPLGMLKQILSREGFSGLYRGLTVMTLRDIPGYGFYFMLYNTFCRALEPQVHPDNANGLIQLAAGGMAGVVSWLPPVYTFDIIKTNMQATSRLVDGPGKTWVHYAADIYRKGGVAAFNKGMGPTLARSFIVDGVQFVGYAWTLHALVYLQKKHAQPSLGADVLAKEQQHVANSG